MPLTRSGPQPRHVPWRGNQIGNLLVHGLMPNWAIQARAQLFLILCPKIHSLSFSLKIKQKPCHPVKNTLFTSQSRNRIIPARSLLSEACGPFPGTNPMTLPWQIYLQTCFASNVTVTLALFALRPLLLVHCSLCPLHVSLNFIFISEREREKHQQWESLAASCRLPEDDPESNPGPSGHRPTLCQTGYGYPFQC